MADLDYSADRCTFSLRTYKHLFTTKNFIASPLSAEIALLVVYNGAKGNTAQEIASVLGRNARNTVETLSANYAQMTTDEIDLRRYTSYDDEDSKDCYKVYIGNDAFLSDCLEVCSQYAENLAKLFEVKGNIHDVVSPGDGILHTALVLSSALYFNTNWERQFSEGKTTWEPFRTASGKSVLLCMTRTTQTFKYCKSKELGNAKILQVPYNGESCSAYFVLPGKKNGLFEKHSSDQVLSNLSKLLAPKKLLAAINGLHPVTHMKVQMPKFTIQHSYVEQVLRALGMPTGSSKADADFSGISPCCTSISKARQKAYVDGSEKITEAAAATLVNLKNYLLPPNPRGKFIADRPFLFFIRHDASNTILFMGHFSDPAVIKYDVKKHN